jgi:hypothetical protein
MARPLSHDAFIEGFPEGIVALIKQGNGRYRIIVSRPPNNPDSILAEAEQRLCEMVEFQDFHKRRKKFDPSGIEGLEDLKDHLNLDDDDDDDEDDD